MSGTGLAVIADMSPDVEHDQNNDHRYNHDIQSMKDRTQALNIMTQQHTKVGQQNAPGQ